MLFIWQFYTDWLKLLLLWPECTVYSTGTVHHCTRLRNMQCSTIAPQMHNLEKSLLCRSCILHFIREIERVNKLITAFFSPSHFLRLQKEEQWTRTINYNARASPTNTYRRSHIFCWLKLNPYVNFELDSLYFIILA